MRQAIVHRVIKEYRERAAQSKGWDGNCYVDKYDSKQWIKRVCADAESIQSESGAMNYGVAVYRDFVIKVVEPSDAVYDLLQRIHSKEIRSKHFPKVFTFQKIENVALVVMERLYTFESARQVSSELRSRRFRNIEESLRKIFKNLRKFHNREDCHSGNIMQRKDGTIVLVDPIA